jgi:hypothetical protein
MNNQIRSNMSAAQQFFRAGSNVVSLLMIGVILIAIVALLPMRDVLNAFSPSSPSETLQAEALKAQWEAAKHDPAIVKALQDEWRATKEKFDADFGVANRLNEEAAIPQERLDEWQAAKHDPFILKELQDEWQVTKDKFNAEFGPALAKFGPALPTMQ